MLPLQYRVRSCRECNIDEISEEVEKNYFVKIARNVARQAYGHAALCTALAYAGPLGSRRTGAMSVHRAQNATCGVGGVQP